MSLVEIKQELQRLTAEELADGEGFLRALRVKNSPGHRERITEANRRIGAGRKISEEQVEAEFKRLRDKTS
jgi:hypothetical protein